MSVQIPSRDEQKPTIRDKMISMIDRCDSRKIRTMLVRKSFGSCVECLVVEVSVAGFLFTVKLLP